MSYDKDPGKYVKSLLEQQQLWEGTIRVSRHDYLVRTGVIDRRLYYVVDGGLIATIRDEVEDHTIRLAYEQSFFGSLDSFLTGVPSRMNIVAIRSSELKYVSYNSLRTFLKSSIEYQNLWEAFLTTLVIQQLEREVDLLTTAPETRYKRVLERSPQVFQHIPLKYIAAYLRMTPETLSRIRKS